MSCTIVILFTFCYNCPPSPPTIIPSFLLPFLLLFFCNLLLHTLPPPPPIILLPFVPPLFPSLPLSLSSGLTKDGGGSANAESLEEVLNILAEEGSDWIYGFFTFLYDVVSSPVEREEEEEGKEGEAAAETTSSDEVKGVILDLQNQ